MSSASAQALFRRKSSCHWLHFGWSRLGAGIVVWGLAALWGLGMATGVAPVALASPSEERDFLTRELAENRSKQIEGVSYGYWLSLDPAVSRIRGRATVRFMLREGAEKISEKIPIELKALELESVTLNGARWKSQELEEHYSKAGAKLWLETSDLRKGENRLELSYTAAYGLPGFGLQRWMDPKDQSVYLTGTFEPYSAHWLVPVFNQPDLKAVSELTVEVPSDWVVVSGTRESQVQSQGGRSSWVFPPTKPMSAYALSLHAGPFRVFKSEAEGVDLRLLVRKSLQRGLVPGDWWTVLSRGIRFYQGRFAFPLPAPKLDVVFVPEVPGQANESVGTLVIEESELQSPMKVWRRTVLKELAQLWFGHLVTMRWWNGLWLKDALASFVSLWALEHEFGENKVWLQFVAEGRAEALYADRSPAAHPVDVSVKDTDQVLPHLDVFTHEKGVALLRQVFSWVGEESFQESLQRYFARYAHRVTTLGDFAHALEEAADLKESLWRRPWLQTVGHPILAAEWTCRSQDAAPEGRTEGARGMLERLVVRQLQKAPRWYRVKVALLGVPESHESSGGRKGRRRRSGGARMDLAPRMLEVAGSAGELRVLQAEGLPCPRGVLLDPFAEGFLETRLDARTDALLAADGGKGLWLDPLVRAGVWQSRLDAVLSGSAPVGPAISALAAALRTERDPEVRAIILGGLVGAGKSRQLGLLRILSVSERLEWGGRLRKIPQLAAQWPFSGLGVSAESLRRAEAVVVDPQAESSAQRGAAERLAAARFWGESSEADRVGFAAWLKKARQALEEVDRGEPPGPRFGGDEERIEELSEWLWPFSCVERRDLAAGESPSRRGGSAWLDGDLAQMSLRMGWEEAQCARLRSRHSAQSAPSPVALAR